MNAREAIEVAGDLYAVGVDRADRDPAGERQRDVGHDERADLEARLEEQVGVATARRVHALDAEPATEAEVGHRGARDVIEEPPADLEHIVAVAPRIVEAKEPAKMKL